MGYIISTIVLLLVVIALFITGSRLKLKSRNPSLRTVQAQDLKTAGFVAKIAGSVILSVVLLITGINSYTQVNPQSLVVEQAFGRTVGHLPNGIHFKAPWDSVIPLDETVQTTTFEGKNCLIVRIADSQTACVDASVQWKLLPSGSDYLFRNYNRGNFMGNVRNALIKRRLEVNLSNTFGNYNPITSATSSTPLGQPGNPTVAQLASSVFIQMKQDVGSWINVKDVLLPRIHYDPSVQNRLNTILAQVAQTAVAQQAIKTALAIATANKDISASVSNNPGVLVQNCLNLVNEAIKANYSLPPGFSCFGASSVGVIASQK